MSPVTGSSYDDAPRPLTDRERSLMKRMFSDFFEVPAEWKTQLKMELERDPPILGSITLGGQGVNVQPNSVLNVHVADGANISLGKLASSGQIGTSSGVEILTDGIRFDGDTKISKSGGGDLEFQIAAGQEFVWRDSAGNAVMSLNEAGDLAIGMIDAKGDLWIGAANDTLGILPLGTNGQVLTVDTTQTLGVKWATPAGGGGGSVATDTIWDTKGDLAVATGADTAAKLAAGANDRLLITDSAQTTGLKWGQATEAMISLSDVTTLNVTSSAHGFAPKSPADATKFLNGATTPAFAQVKDSDLSTSDITTNNVSASKHGFMPKLPGGTTNFYREDGSWATPAAPASPVIANAQTADVTASAAETYLLGLNVGGRVKAGTMIRWRGRMTKTAAGTATPIWQVRVGTAGSTADTSRVSITGVAQTNVADEGWVEVELVFRAVGATTAVISVSIMFTHRLATTGLQNTQVQVYNGISGTFDSTGSTLIVGLTCNPGASGVWTFQTVSAQATNLT